MHVNSYQIVQIMESVLMWMFVHVIPVGPIYHATNSPVYQSIIVLIQMEYVLGLINAIVHTNGVEIIVVHLYVIMSVLSIHLLVQHMAYVHHLIIVPVCKIMLERIVNIQFVLD